MIELVRELKCGPAIANHHKVQKCPSSDATTFSAP